MPRVQELLGLLEEAASDGVPLLPLAPLPVIPKSKSQNKRVKGRWRRANRVWETGCSIIIMISEFGMPLLR